MSSLVQVPDSEEKVPEHTDASKGNDFPLIIKSSHKLFSGLQNKRTFHLKRTDMLNKTNVRLKENVQTFSVPPVSIKLNRIQEKTETGHIREKRNFAH